MPVAVPQKALEINLMPQIYGTFAEIGGGQEVARHFFRVGGASGTIAKSMSAYDMVVSDDIYGACERYVSEERLLRMMSYEYDLLQMRLRDKRQQPTCFFVFADTVSTRSFQVQQDGQGWVGVRFQISPDGPPNEVEIGRAHV